MNQVKKAGRPPKYVKDHGNEIVGLSGPKAPVDVDGRYYTTHNDPKTGLREYFGRNKKTAIALFKVWANHSGLTARNRRD